MDFMYQQFNAANQQNLLNSTMIMGDNANAVNALAANVNNISNLDDLIRVQTSNSTLQVQIAELKKKNWKLESEIEKLKKEASAFEITCQIKQLEFETQYVRDVELKLTRAKQEREAKLKQHIDDLNNTKIQMEAHYRETIEQKDAEIDELKAKCAEIKSLEEKNSSLQADVEKTQKMNLGLIAQLEVSKLELEELHNKQKQVDEFFDEESRHVVGLLKELRVENFENMNNNSNIIRNLNSKDSAATGNLMAGTLAVDDKDCMLKELNNLDRSELISRVHVYSKLVLKIQNQLQNLRLETKKEIDALKTEIKNKTVLHESVTLKLNEKNQLINSLNKTIEEMKLHNQLLEEAHEKLSNKVDLFEKDLGSTETRNALDVFFKELESCVISLHEVSEYFFEIYNNNNQTNEAFKIKSEKKKIKEFFSKSNVNSIVLALLDASFISNKMSEFKELKLKLNEIRTFAGLINLNDF